jgi:hypothetical protein
MGKKNRAEAERALREQAGEFFERAKNLDFNKADAIVAGTVAGLGIAAVAGYLTFKRHGGKVKAADGEEVAVANSPTQYMEGAASYVREDGSAASFPASDEAAGRLGTDGNAALFIVGPGGEITRGAHQDPRYKRTAQWAIDFARGVLPDFMQGEPQTPPQLPEQAPES